MKFSHASAFMLKVEPGTITLRILCIQKDIASESPTIPFLAIDKDARFFAGYVDRALVTDKMTGDTMIKCTTDKVIDDEEYGQKLEVSIDDSIEIIPDDPSFQKVSQLESKLKDIDLQKEIMF